MPSKCNWNLSELQLLLTLTLAAPQLSALPPSQGISLLASKIKVPKIDGNPLHWCQFWGDFEELIASNTSLTNIEKFTYLNQALLTPESQKIAADAGDPRKNFDKSVKALKACYEDKRLIYQCSVQKFVETGRDLGLNRKDLNSLKSSLNGIETTMEQCEGDTLDQTKAAIMLLKFGRDLEAAWKRETTKLKEPPSTKIVVDFLDDQLTSISGTREEFDHIQPLSHPPSGKQTRRLYTEFLPPQHLAAVLLAPAQDTAWLGAMPTETGASKERTTWSRPTICVTTAFKLATESLPAQTKEPVESAKGGTTPLCMIQPRW